MRQAALLLPTAIKSPRCCDQQMSDQEAVTPGALAVQLMPSGLVMTVLLLFRGNATNNPGLPFVQPTKAQFPVGQLRAVQLMPSVLVITLFLHTATSWPWYS